MKKKSLYFWGATFISAVAFSFASCSQEDDFIIDSGLDIDSQVPLTRSEGGDGFGINVDPGTLTHIEQYSCQIVALVNTSRAPGGNWNGSQTAQERYDEILYYAEHTLGYTRGKPMDNKMFESLASHYNYGGEEKGADNVVNYFNGHKSGGKMVYYQKIDELTGELKGHWATVSSFDKDSSKNPSQRTVEVFNEFGKTEEIYMSEITSLRHYKKPEKNK